MITPKRMKKCKKIKKKKNLTFYVRVLFHLVNSNSAVKNCGKSFACSQYIKEDIEHAFKTVSKKFEIMVSFNCESKNLIYVLICSSRKKEYIWKTQPMFKEKLNTYRQHFR